LAASRVTCYSHHVVRLTGQLGSGDSCDMAAEHASWVGRDDGRYDDGDSCRPNPTPTVSVTECEAHHTLSKLVLCLNLASEVAPCSQTVIGSKKLRSARRAALTGRCLALPQAPDPFRFAPHLAQALPPPLPTPHCSRALRSGCPRTTKYGSCPLVALTPILWAAMAHRTPFLAREVRRRAEKGIK
jgi:hypothetical protein